jgi:hypothetical protein
MTMMDDNLPPSRVYGGVLLHHTAPMAIVLSSFPVRRIAVVVTTLT